VVIVQDAMVIDTMEPALPGWLTDMAGTLGVEGMIIGGERLRLWGLSEVWRVQLGGAEPRSVIVKRGAGEMADEARRYRQLVVPLAVPAPQLLAATDGAGADSAVLVLQDIGQDTLEQRPSADGYRAAIRALARMRTTAARQLSADPLIGAGLRMTTAGFVDTARRADAGLAVMRPDLAGWLDSPAQVLVNRLDRLTGEPDTIVHGDFHAKNLIHAHGGRIVAIDWPGAYLHSHLGDLYCLLREAGKRGLAQEVETAALPEIFARETGAEIRTVLDDLVTGGLCWTMLTLRWLVEEGVQAIPESREWIDELVADCQALADGVIR
jgi:hypothetical protein